MNLCRCERGHFYDKEKYATCPHCSGGSAADNRLTEAFTEDVTTAVTQPKALENPMGNFSVQGGKTEEFKIEDLPVPGERADEKTVADYSAFMDTPTIPMNQFQTQQQIQLPPGNEPMDGDDDHTIGFYDEFFEPAPPSSEMNVPVKGSMAVNKVSTPCVGWLIALGGGHIGMDFRLKVGKNFIGRSSNMDVALMEDMSVSRDRHAIVVYEPKAHLYLVQPGESSGLVYRNDEVVLTPVKLEAYDIVTVGDVNLLFMPLCGTRFNWGELLKKMRDGNE